MCCFDVAMHPHLYGAIVSDLSHRVHAQRGWQRSRSSSISTNMGVRALPISAPSPFDRRGSSQVRARAEADVSANLSNSAVLVSTLAIFAKQAEDFHPCTFPSIASLCSELCAPRGVRFALQRRCLACAINVNIGCKFQVASTIRAMQIAVPMHALATACVIGGHTPCSFAASGTCLRSSL